MVKYNISGGAGNDNLFGGIEDNYVKGGTGNDSIMGGYGDDTILGDGQNIAGTIGGVTYTIASAPFTYASGANLGGGLNGGTVHTTDVGSSEVSDLRITLYDGNTTVKPREKISFRFVDENSNVVYVENATVQQSSGGEGTPETGVLVAQGADETGRQIALIVDFWKNSIIEESYYLNSDVMPAEANNTDISLDLAKAINPVTTIVPKMFELDTPFTYATGDNIGDGQVNFTSFHVSDVASSELSNLRITLLDGNFTLTEGEMVQISFTDQYGNEIVINDAIIQQSAFSDGTPGSGLITAQGTDNNGRPIVVITDSTGDHIGPGAGYYDNDSQQSLSNGTDVFLDPADAIDLDSYDDFIIGGTGSDLILGGAGDDTIFGDGPNGQPNETLYTIGSAPFTYGSGANIADVLNGETSHFADVGSDKVSDLRITTYDGNNTLSAGERISFRFVDENNNVVYVENATVQQTAFGDGTPETGVFTAQGADETGKEIALFVNFGKNFINAGNGYYISDEVLPAGSNTTDVILDPAKAIDPATTIVPKMFDLDLAFSYATGNNIGDGQSGPGDPAIFHRADVASSEVSNLRFTLLDGNFTLTEGEMVRISFTDENGKQVVIDDAIIQQTAFSDGTPETGVITAQGTTADGEPIAVIVDSDKTLIQADGSYLDSDADADSRNGADFFFDPADAIELVGYDDSINGGTGNDSIIGGFGDDTIAGGSGADTIAGNTGDDLIYGGGSEPGTYTALGFEFNREFTVSEVNVLKWNDLTKVHITGNAKEIVFKDDDGVLNNDTVTEMFSVNDATQTVLVDGVEHAANIEGTVRLAGSDGGTYTLGIVQVDINNSDSAEYDSIEQAYYLVSFGTPPAPGVTFTEITRNVTSDQPYSAFTVPIEDSGDLIDGGSGNDTIFGQDGADTIAGNTGDDVIYGGSDDSDDQIIGGSGNDSILGGAGDDTIFGDGPNGHAEPNETLYTIASAPFTYASGANLGDGLTGGTPHVPNVGSSEVSDLRITTYDGNNTLSAGERVSFRFIDENNNVVFVDNATVQQTAFGDGTPETGVFTAQGADETGKEIALLVDFGTNSITTANSFFATDVLPDGSNNTDVILDPAKAISPITTVVPKMFELDVAFTYGTGTNIGDGQAFSSNYHRGDVDSSELSNLRITLLDGNFTLTEGEMVQISFADENGDQIVINDAIIQQTAFSDGTPETGVITAQGTDADGEPIVVIVHFGQPLIEAGAPYFANDVEAELSNGTDVSFDPAKALDVDAYDDTLVGGIGNDSLTGGFGDDTFVYEAGDGSDIITDFNFDNSGSINNGDQTDNDFVDLSSFYTDLARDEITATGTERFKHNLDMLHQDAADGKLDGIINGKDYSANISGIDLSLKNQGTAVTGTDLTFDNTNVACFVRGTLIKTNRGDVPIENIRQGDLVNTLDHGDQPVRWIGSCKIPTAILEQKPNLRPVRIQKNALGDGLPQSDLCVSPQHRILVRSSIVDRMFGTTEVLVAAKHLVSLSGIDVVDDMTVVEYFHLLFDAHEVIYSNGAVTESMYTGPEALKSVSSVARQEIIELFPELAEMDYSSGTARKLVGGRQSRRMALRHKNNQKGLVQPISGK